MKYKQACFPYHHTLQKPPHLNMESGKDNMQGLKLIMSPAKVAKQRCN